MNVDLSERITALPPEKRLLLLQQLRNRRSESQIHAQKRETNTFPLTPAQERLWFSHQMNPESPLYNEPAVFRITGPLDRGAIERSLNEIVRRHEILRTSFAVVDGFPRQIVSPSRPLPVPVADLRALPVEAREAEVQRLIGEAVRLPFDLTNGPLLRALLLWLGEEEHLLALVFHHTIFDDWSGKIFEQELVVLYQSYTGHRFVSQEEAPIQYADYALWLRQWLHSGVLDSQVAYWKQQLGDEVPTLALPADRPRPAVQSFRGALFVAHLPQPLFEAVKAFSYREDVTLFTTLLAAFKALLFRYTGQDTIVVGTSIANRTRREIERLIGCFINMLVLRTDLSGDQSFRDLLQSVRQMTLDAFAHQDLPFEQLVEILQPQRSPNHTPLFQVLFSFQSTSLQAVDLGSCSMQRLEGHNGMAKFDLAIGLNEADDGLAVSVEYSTDLFDAPTIARMVGHYQTLVEGLVVDPDQRLSDLPLLSHAERRRLLIDWNATSVDREPVCIHTLFERQVERTPEAIAVVFEEQHLTYHELNRRANQVAHKLRSLDVCPGVRQGIFARRSIEMVLAVLGTLKAGGAYVPLDVSYPRERLAFMLADSGVSGLLTQAHLEQALPIHTAQLVRLDAELEAIAQLPQHNPSSGVTAADLAYVIYTSGSTGRPKGAMLPHSAVTNNLLALTAAHGLDASCRMLQFVSLSFDVSVEEIFLALTSGGTLVLHPNPTDLSPAELLLECRRLGVTTMHMTPAYWHQIVDEVVAAHRPIPACLKLLIVGGESPSAERLAAWARLACHPTRFVNAYGPTEATITSLFYAAPMEAAALGALSKLPIGHPIANKQIYLLDRRLRPVPVGVPGELYIGGAGLAQGYLDRPELTAERFIPNPFLRVEDRELKIEDSSLAAHHERSSILYPLSSTRLYRTGDLARYLPDGNIEFLGRVDQQTKIRGFRVELGEIEAVLGQHPSVRKAVVLAREDVPGERHLVAYIVPTTDHRPPTTEGPAEASVVGRQSSVVGELRAFLQEKLPNYMLPSAFVLLDALPLTPNGKLDRRRLPLPGEADRFQRASVAPRNAVEDTLAGIWAGCLGMQQLGVDDNFFELGGHSLLITQVLFQTQQLFCVELPARAFLEAPTIAGLAVALAHHEPIPGQVAKIAELHKQIDSMSAGDLQAALQAKRQARSVPQ